MQNIDMIASFHSTHPYPMAPTPYAAMPPGSHCSSSNSTYTSHSSVQKINRWSTKIALVHKNTRTLCSDNSNSRHQENARKMFHEANETRKSGQKSTRNKIRRFQKNACKEGPSNIATAHAPSEYQIGVFLFHRTFVIEELCHDITIH